MMVSEPEGEIALSKVDPCGICGKRVGSRLRVAHTVRSECMGDARK